jgi:hypothetical protein
MSKNDESEPEQPERPVGPRQFTAKAAKELGLVGPDDDSEECREIVQRIARQMHDVGVNSSLERRSTSELMLLKLRNLAITGHPRAIRAYDKYKDIYGPQASDGAGYLVVSGEKTPEQIVAEIERHNRRADARRAEELRQKELLKKSQT